MRSPREIIEKMRAYHAQWKLIGDDISFYHEAIERMNEFADELEAAMSEPVGVVTVRNYPEHRIAMVGDGVHSWVNEGEKTALFFKELSPATQLFAIPPDAQATIERLEKRVAELEKDAARLGTALLQSQESHNG